MRTPVAAIYLYRAEKRVANPGKALQISKPLPAGWQPFIQNPTFNIQNSKTRS